VHVAQQEFTRAERQNHSDDQVQHSPGGFFGEATSPATRNEREPGTRYREDESSEPLQYHVGMVRQKKRRHEVPIKEFLICDKRTREERDSNRRDHRFCYYSRPHGAAVRVKRHTYIFQNFTSISFRKRVISNELKLNLNVANIFHCLSRGSPGFLKTRAST
jgi:hypothetical protein